MQYEKRIDEPGSEASFMLSDELPVRMGEMSEMVMKEV
jgi:hypothetical protein